VNLNYRYSLLSDNCSDVKNKDNAENLEIQNFAKNANIYFAR